MVLSIPKGGRQGQGVLTETHRRERQEERPFSSISNNKAMMLNTAREEGLNSNRKRSRSREEALVAFSETKLEKKVNLRKIIKTKKRKMLMYREAPRKAKAKQEGGKGGVLGSKKKGCRKVLFNGSRGGKGIRRGLMLVWQLEGHPDMTELKVSEGEESKGRRGGRD